MKSSPLLLTALYLLAYSSTSFGAAGLRKRAATLSEVPEELMHALSQQEMLKAATYIDVIDNRPRRHQPPFCCFPESLPRENVYAICCFFGIIAAGAAHNAVMHHKTN